MTLKCSVCSAFLFIVQDVDLNLELSRDLGFGSRVTISSRKLRDVGKTDDFLNHENYLD